MSWSQNFSLSGSMRSPLREREMTLVTSHREHAHPTSAQDRDMSGQAAQRTLYFSRPPPPDNQHKSLLILNIS